PAPPPSSGTPKSGRTAPPASFRSARIVRTGSAAANRSRPAAPPAEGGPVHRARSVPESACAPTAKPNRKQRAESRGPQRRSPSAKARRSPTRQESASSFWSAKSVGLKNASSFGRSEERQESVHFCVARGVQNRSRVANGRSEEHTSELQSRENLVCLLLLEKKKANNNKA